jgi:hypothetical protein
MSTERLQHLITILEKVPEEKFDLLSWHCGTTACAVGHAALDPVFNAQGFKLSPGIYSQAAHPTFKPDEDSETHTGWSAVAEFFDLSYGMACYLFDKARYDELNPTTADVIKRIKLYLEQ